MPDIRQPRRNSDKNRDRREPSQASPRRRKRPQGVIPTIKYYVTRARKKLLRSPLVPLIGGLVLLVAIVALLLWIFTNKNAFDVQVDGKSVAFIAKSKTITDDTWIYNNALAKLEADLGAKVQVSQKVTLTAVHKSKKKLSDGDYAISAVYQKFSDSEYKVQASEIFVNNVSIAIVKNLETANKVKESVLNKYKTETVKEATFVEDFKISPKFVTSGAIATDEQAIARLSIQAELEQDYIVKSGDNVWIICNKQQITQDKFYQLNPSITPGSTLSVGQKVLLPLNKPLLSVRTVEEVTYTDVAKRPVEERPNATKARSYRKVLQAGKDGQKEVTGQLIKINGIETEKKEISSKIIAPPVVEIIEVGTK